MKIENLEKDRIEKIESLLIDKMDLEIELLNKQIIKIDYTENEKKLLKKSLDFALRQDYGENLLYKYYAAHPIRVTRLVLEWLEVIGEKHFELVRGSIIHNALEKKIITPEELESEYGSWTKNTIEAITVDRVAQKQPGWAKGYFESILKLDKYGQILKSFDKLDNIYALCLNPDEEVRTNYMDEIEKYIQPIINKHAPYLSEYFQELINTTKKMGHKSVESYLMEFKK